MTKRYIIYPTISLPCSDNITSFARYLVCDQFKWCPCISWTNVIRITPVCCHNGLNLIGNRKYNSIMIIFNKYSPYKSLDGTSGEVSMILADGPGSHFITWLNFDQTWISNHMLSNVWDEIIYPLANFNDCALEVWEWINSFIPNLMMNAITDPCWD